MSGNPLYKNHWINIDSERLERYQRMFQWNPGSSTLYEPADIRPGQIVAEFGCGPGHTAIEIARWVAPNGVVHALDINADFITQTRKNAEAAAVGNRVIVHQCDGVALPLSDESLDRLTTRNTLIYVDDPERTICEFRRTIRPGGKMHAIEGDWPMMVVEPVPSDDWAGFVNAASRGCKTPDIGRKLYGLLRRAGFVNINVQVITRPDADGRLLPMFETLADYARAADNVNAADIERVIAIIKNAISNKDYLAAVPQFVVTATR